MTARTHLLALLCMHAALVTPAIGQPEGPNASVSVIVRDLRGQPVSGLGPEQFRVHDAGGMIPVVAAVSSTSAAPRAEQAPDHVVILIPPMSPASAHLALASVAKALPLLTSCCVVRILGPEAQVAPFTRDAHVLEHLLEDARTRVATRAQLEEWATQEGRCLRALRIAPGRHVILFANTTPAGAPRLDPSALPRVSPAMMTTAAISAGASVYSVQVDGPPPIVPFGGAADDSDGELTSVERGLLYGGVTGTAAPEFQRWIMQNHLDNAAVMQGEALMLSSATGGVPAGSFADAVAAMRRDDAGYYRLQLAPPANRTDDSWHRVSVSTAVANTHASAGGYALFLRDTAQRGAVPVELLAAVDAPASNAIPIQMREWFFPDQTRNNAYTLPFAIAVGAPADASTDSYDVFIRMTDSSLGLQTGTWFLPAAHPVGGTVVRQYEAVVGPGRYTFDVVARDTRSNVIAHLHQTIGVESVAAQIFAPSSLVLSRSCTTTDSVAGRMRLDDPLIVDGCSLALSPHHELRVGDTATLLLRLYPRDRATQAALLTHATLSVRLDGNLLRNDLRLSAGEQRGLRLSLPLLIAGDTFALGPHEISVHLRSADKKDLTVTTERVVISATSVGAEH